jgi:hypothetical protein
MSIKIFALLGTSKGKVEHMAVQNVLISMRLFDFE